MNPRKFVDDLSDRLAKAGLGDFELVRASCEPVDFEDEAIFRLPWILLRFLRDKGQMFLDLAALDEPEKFYQFSDVEVAMGWATIADLLDIKRIAEPEDIVLKLKKHTPELIEALSGSRAQFTRARIETAAKERREALRRRFQGSEDPSV